MFTVRRGRCWWRPTCPTRRARQYGGQHSWPVSTARWSPRQFENHWAITPFTTRHKHRGLTGRRISGTETAQFGVHRRIVASSGSDGGVPCSAWSSRKARTRGDQSKENQFVE